MTLLSPPSADSSPALRAGWYLALALAVAAATAAGAAVTVFIHPVAGFGLIAGVVAGVAMLVNTNIGFAAIVAVLYLLPFAVMPLPIGGVRLTFLDAALTVVLLVWAFRMLTNSGYPLITSPFDITIVVFLSLAVVSLVIGINSVSTEILRFFLKTINSVLVFWTVLNVIRDTRTLTLAVRLVIGAAGVSGMVATVLYVLPDEISSSLLNSLRVFNYPSGAVLRYIAETDIERAIGTAIDPNILGGMLMLPVPVIFAQLMSRAPVLSRRLLWIAAFFTGAGLLLTYSRGSWLGALASLIALGTLRYRKLWLLFIPLVAGVFLIPDADVITQRISGAIQGTDLATQMRLGEINDALRLIQRYPWFGVGFGTAPDVDLFLGRASAASLYLIIAQQMGLIGLAAFLVAMAAFGLYVVHHRVPASKPALQAIQLGFTGSIVAALVGGLVDHYFFNLDFPHTIALFWLFLGLATVATRIGAGEPDPAVEQGRERAHAAVEPVASR